MLKKLVKYNLKEEFKNFWSSEHGVLIILICIILLWKIIGIPTIDFTSSMKLDIVFYTAIFSIFAIKKQYQNTIKKFFTKESYFYSTIPITRKQLFDADILTRLIKIISLNLIEAIAYMLVFEDIFYTTIYLGVSAILVFIIEAIYQTITFDKIKCNRQNKNIKNISWLCVLLIILPLIISGILFAGISIVEFNNIAQNEIITNEAVNYEIANEKLIVNGVVENNAFEIIKVAITRLWSFGNIFIIVHTIFAVTFYIINIKLLKKGLNVE